MVASVTEPPSAYDSLPGRHLDVVVLSQMQSRIYAELQGQLRASRLRSSGLARAAAIRRTLHRLFGQSRSKAEQRSFFLFAAPLMRGILLRTLSPLPSLRGVPSDALHRSLCQLELIAPHLAQMIDLHYFAGFSLREVGELLGNSEADLSRDMRFVRAWLMHAPGRLAEPDRFNPTRPEEPT